MDAVQAQGAFALADPSCLHVTEVRDAGAVDAPPSSPREPASLLDLLAEADGADIFDEADGLQLAQRVRGERKRRRGGKSHAAARRVREEASTASGVISQQHGSQLAAGEA